MSKSWIEELYDTTYKAETGNGATHRAAHMLALEAIYDAGKRTVKTHPFREKFSRCLKKLEKRISP